MREQFPVPRAGFDNLLRFEPEGNRDGFLPHMVASTSKSAVSSVLVLNLSQSGELCHLHVNAERPGFFAMYLSRLEVAMPDTFKDKAGAGVTISENGLPQNYALFPPDIPPPPISQSPGASLADTELCKKWVEAALEDGLLVEDAVKLLAAVHQNLSFRSWQRNYKGPAKGRKLITLNPGRLRIRKLGKCFSTLS